MYPDFVARMTLRNLTNVMKKTKTSKKPEVIIGRREKREPGEFSIMGVNREAAVRFYQPVPLGCI